MINTVKKPKHTQKYKYFALKVIAVAVLMLFYAVVPVFAAENTELSPGDVNGDEKVSPLDYLIVKRYYFGTLDLSEEQLNAADVDESGVVNQYDYILIKRIYFGTYQVPENNEPEVPEYVAKEAERVAEIVLSQQNENTITGIFFTDSHYDIQDEQNKESLTHAAQAMEIIAKKCNVDFFADLGDKTVAGTTHTLERAEEEIKAVNKLTEGVRRAVAQTFDTEGNHDNLIRSYAVNGRYFTRAEMYSMFAALNEGVTKPETEVDRGYFYKDFENKKVRVIVLNTCDSKDIEGAPGAWYSELMSAAQTKWFAQTLDMSEKEDAGDWNILIMSHHPLDWGWMMQNVALLEAYRNGEKYTARFNVSGIYKDIEISYDFEGKNAATIIGQIHGHTHNFTVSDLYLDTKTTIPIKRMAIPNASFTRSNEYGINGTKESYLEYGEFGGDGKAVVYSKTAGTANDTAFCVVTIDLETQEIFLTNYGAGYDRVVNYGDGTIKSYGITNSLNNVETDNSAKSIKSGKSYSASIKAAEGYVISAINVKMGEADITASAYSDGVINIPEVTGDIVITASAISVSDDRTDLLANAIDENGGIYNGTGYKKGYRLSGTTGFEKENEGFVLTGYIPFKNGNTLTALNVKPTTTRATERYVWLYDENFNPLGAFMPAYNNTEAFEWTLSRASCENAAYIRISIYADFTEKTVISVN